MQAEVFISFVHYYTTNDYRSVGAFFVERRKRKKGKRIGGRERREKKKGVKKGEEVHMCLPTSGLLSWFSLFPRLLTLLKPIKYFFSLIT